MFWVTRIDMISTPVEVSLPSQSIIGSPVTALPFDAQMETILHWASDRTSRIVCVANVHMLVEARLDPDLADVLKTADLVTPDGMPLVWMMNLLGTRGQDRVAGMDILMSLCRQSRSHDVSIFFLGSHDTILGRMRQRLEREFPNVHIAGMEPLPFRPLTIEEDEAIIQKVNESGAGIVMLSLGCPKQELWMAQHKDKIEAVMIGLGGAFPVYAGIHRWAPSWIRQSGLEWLYRLVQEPRRLWKRYGTTIPPFMCLALKQLLASYLKPNVSPKQRRKVVV
jgi:N-acetylglucosaminyldiphosphoundecaprenol N-acetyl-beta-D-mannosaminyltransferase